MTLMSVLARSDEHCVHLKNGVKSKQSFHQAHRDKSENRKNNERKNISRDKNEIQDCAEANLKIIVQNIAFKKTKRIKKLSPLKNCHPEQLENLLIQKINLCCIVYKSERETCSVVKLKETKISTLNELTNFVIDGNEIPFSVYPHVFEMFSANVFRGLPPPRDSAGCDFDLDDDESFASQHDPFWPQLERVYQFILGFFESPKLSLVHSRSFVDQKFVLNLLTMFDSEDPNERGYLKLVLHKIYERYLSLRHFTRKQINYVFFTFIYETRRHNGIYELLVTLASFINGFARPLKNEHVVFLRKALMPLHKVESLHSYSSPLINCVILFLKKDETLVEPVVKALIKYWPKSDSKNEIIFIDELNEILYCVDRVRQKVEGMIIEQLRKCISKPHIQIKEKAHTILDVFFPN